MLRKLEKSASTTVSRNGDIIEMFATREEKTPYIKIVYRIIWAKKVIQVAKNKQSAGGKVARKSDLANYKLRFFDLLFA